MHELHTQGFESMRCLVCAQQSNSVCVRMQCIMHMLATPACTQRRRPAGPYRPNCRPLHKRPGPPSPPNLPDGQVHPHSWPGSPTLMARFTHTHGQVHPHSWPGHKQQDSPASPHPIANTTGQPHTSRSWRSAMTAFPSVAHKSRQARVTCACTAGCVLPPQRWLCAAPWPHHALSVRNGGRGRHGCRADCGPPGC